MEPHLRQVLSEIEAAKDRARSSRKLDQTTLALAVISTIGPTKLLELVADYRSKFPNVRLSVRNATAQDLQEILFQGDLEVALFGLPEGLDDRLHLMPLFEERFVITFAPGHRFEHLPVIRDADLDGEPYVARVNCECTGYAGDQIGAAGNGPRPT